MRRAQELATRDFSIAVDCHSGFGVSDRLWFPHAHTTQPIERLSELHAMSCLLGDGFMAVDQEESAAVPFAFGHVQPGDRLLANWNSIRRLRPVARGNALRQLLAAARFRFDGPAPTMPTLVISSAGDHLVDPICSQALAQHWDSEHIVHAHAGHDLALDDGPWLANHLVDWLHRRVARNAGTPTSRNVSEADQ